MIAIDDDVNAEAQDDFDDTSLLPPDKKAKLVDYTVAVALSNRHPLDLYWSIAAPEPAQHRPPERGRR